MLAALPSTLDVLRVKTKAYLAVRLYTFARSLMPLIACRCYLRRTRWWIQWCLRVTRCANPCLCTPLAVMATPDAFVSYSKHAPMSTVPIRISKLLFKPPRTQARWKFCSCCWLRMLPSSLTRLIMGHYTSLVWEATVSVQSSCSPPALASIVWTIKPERL